MQVGKRVQPPLVYVNVAMRARDQSSIFSIGGEISPWLWASIGVTRSYSSRPFLCTLGAMHGCCSNLVNSYDCNSTCCTRTTNTLQ